jgi:hypothetical protein
MLATAATATVHAVRADDLVPITIDYEARPGCPGNDVFVREVLARAPRARMATGSERARSLVARVRPGGAHGLDGVLAVRDGSGPASERNVHAQSCDELVTALAIIAAVVIDPMTARTAADAGSLATPEDAAAPPSTTTADAAPQLPAAPAPPADTSPVLPPASPNAGPTAENGWTLSAGAGAGLVGGAAPSVLLSVPAFVEVSRQLGGIVEPSVRLRFERTAIASTSDRTGGGARFVRTGGAADLCPIALRARSLRAQPCLRAELAALYARGRNVDPARSDVRPWFAVGPVVRVRLEIVGPLFVELEAAILVAAVRDRFYVEPTTLLYRPPALGATTAFAVGLAFR